MTGTQGQAQYDPDDPRARAIAVARGEAPADLAIRGAQVFDAFTASWLDADVLVAGPLVAAVVPRSDTSRPTEAAVDVDATGRYLVPGLLDAHLHIESSKLTPASFAEVVVPRGTTAIVAEPHEVGNVLGVRGVEWFLDACDDLPLTVYAMAPSCVPASDFESPGETIDPEGIARIAGHERVLGIGEMMNFPGVIAGAPGELAKLAAREAGQHVDGHAPGVRGRDLDAYAAAGIGSDHESTTAEEALDKRRRGMWVLMREASNARNLVDLLPLVLEHGTDRCAFCTDDREPDFLVEHGHIDQMCRVAVAGGLTPEQALVLATINPARAHGLDRSGHGAIAPGWRADLALLDDLTDFRVAQVWHAGRLVAEDGAMVVDVRHAEAPDWVLDSMHAAPVGEGDFALPGVPEGEQVRVIGIVEGQLLTRDLREVPTQVGGATVADPMRDLAKLAVVERHHATGRVGVGLVRGFGLARGAFASTVAHDAHNVVVVGVDEASMVACVERLGEIGGGIVVADGGRVVGELALPVAGLVTDAPGVDAAAAMDTLHAQLREQGVGPEAPFMILSFLALSVIPSLKLTDRGLVDVDAFELVDFAASGAQAAAGTAVTR